MLAVLAGPLHLQPAERLEGVEQRLLRDVPRDPAQEHLGAVDRVPVPARRQLAGPGADDLRHLEVLLGVRALQLLARVEGRRLVGGLVEVVGQERRVGRLRGEAQAVVRRGGRVPQLRHLEALVDRAQEERARARARHRGRRLRRKLRLPEPVLGRRLAEPVGRGRVDDVRHDGLQGLGGVGGTVRGVLLHGRTHDGRGEGLGRL